MNEQDFWSSIPHGKNDPPMLLHDASKAMYYDFNDLDNQLVMFNRELEGCVIFPFTKPMDNGVRGIATVDGQAVQCTLQPMKLAGYDAWWVGVKLAGYINEYGKSATLEIRGFRDTDGNDMVPFSCTVEALSKVAPMDQYAEHEAVALQAAQDGIVLMKNDHQTLPLTPNRVLNLFGKGMYEFRLCAVGAGKIYPRYAVGLMEAAREDGHINLNQELLRFYARGIDAVPDSGILERARELSDTAVMVISRMSGENFDNSTNPGEYDLTQEEKTLLKALRDAFARLVVILNVGYPISLAYLEKLGVDAIVYNGFGGMLAGTALMDILTGRVNPSGKLPDTWALEYEHIPSSRNFYNCVGGKQRVHADDGEIWINTVYEEDIYVGYRYFETFPNADRKGYCFGHGLSYTTFEISCKECHYSDAGLELTAAVRNVGTVPGREVVQVYVSKPQGKLEQPARELVGFEKTKLLAPGECEELTICVPHSHMVSFDEQQAAFVMVQGNYAVLLGNSVRNAVNVGSFELSEQLVVKQVKNRMRLNTSIECLRQGGAIPEGNRSGIVEGSHELTPKRNGLEQFPKQILPTSEKAITFRDVLSDENLLPEFVGNMDVKTLARIAVCASDGWGMEGRGEAGRLYRVEGLDLPEFIVADGNSGVNLRTRNIGMPSGATLCASFDKELMEQVGRVIGEESRELGVHLILAPALNLHRNPLNGRQPEYFSEDPYLAGTLSGFYCRGLESTGVGGCYKHLIANNAESSRKRNQSIITERAIRELYFRAFEYALEIHEPVSVMTAYNAVNGVFTSCDPELIQGMLFEECGFKGFVMTDWSSYDSADVAEMEMAGNTWITPGSMDDTYTKRIEEAVKDGRLPLAQLQDNVLRMVRALIILNK